MRSWPHSRQWCWTTPRAQCTATPRMRPLRAAPALRRRRCEWPRMQAARSVCRHQCVVVFRFTFTRMWQRAAPGCAPRAVAQALSHQRRQGEDAVPHSGGHASCMPSHGCALMWTALGRVRKVRSCLRVSADSSPNVALPWVGCRRPLRFPLCSQLFHLRVCVAVLCQ